MHGKKWMPIEPQNRCQLNVFVLDSNSDKMEALIVWHHEREL